jgi:hypothetical protein
MFQVQVTVQVAISRQQSPEYFWLVVSTPLKNSSQLGLLFPIYGKIKNVPNHQAVMVKPP